MKASERRDIVIYKTVNMRKRKEKGEGGCIKHHFRSLFYVTWIQNAFGVRE